MENGGVVEEPVETLMDETEDEANNNNNVWEDFAAELLRQ